MTIGRSGMGVKRAASPAARALVLARFVLHPTRSAVRDVAGTIRARICPSRGQMLLGRADREQFEHGHAGRPAPPHLLPLRPAGRVATADRPAAAGAALPDESAQ